MFTGWLTCISQSLRPHFLLSFHDRKYARRPPMPIASVVMGKRKKKRKTMSKTIKWILIVLGVGLLSCLFLIFGMVSLIGTFDKGYSKQDLIDNYIKRNKEIDELKTYINSITSVDKYVDIEFEGDNEIAIFNVSVNGNFENNWNLNINSLKTDTLLQKIGWTKDNLRIIKKKLDNAHCISVRNGEPCNIGFQRSGMGKYFYNIFSKPMSDSLKNKYKDNCMYLTYNNTVVLEYGSGAIGSLCFPDK